MGIVEEELDETLFWLEFIVALTPDTRHQIGPIWKEGNELLSITVAAIKTSRKGLANPQSVIRNP
jgi:hypothetical protein